MTISYQGIDEASALRRYWEDYFRRQREQGQAQSSGDSSGTSMPSYSSYKLFTGRGAEASGGGSEAPGASGASGGSSGSAWGSPGAIAAYIAAGGAFRNLNTKGTFDRIFGTGDKIKSTFKEIDPAGDASNKNYLNRFAEKPLPFLFPGEHNALKTDKLLFKPLRGKIRLFK